MLPLPAMIAIALAGDEPVRVEWDAPHGCPSAEEVRAQILVPPSDRSRVGVSGRVWSEGDRWFLDLSLETDGEQSQRRLDSASCDVLAHTAAFVVALHLGWSRAPPPPASAPPPEPRLQRPQAVRGPTPKPPEPPPARAVPPPPPVVTATRDDLPPPRRSNSARTRAPSDARGSVFAYGGAGFGAVPTVDLAAGGGAALVFPRWRIEAGGMYVAQRTANVDQPAGVGVDVRLATAQLAGGPTLHHKRLEFPLLASLEGGVMRGVGVGVDDARAIPSPWLALGLQAGLSVEIHRAVHLWSRIAGHAALRRPDFVIDGLGRVYGAAVGTVALRAGLEVRFP